MANVLNGFKEAVDARIADKVDDYSITKDDVSDTIKELADLALLIPESNPSVTYPKNYLTRNGAYTLFVSLQDNASGDTTNTSNWQAVSGGGGGTQSVYDLGVITDDFANGYEASVPSIIAYSTSVIYLFKPDVSNTGASTLQINALATLPIRKYENGAIVDVSGGDLNSASTYPLIYKGTYFLVLGGIVGAGYLENVVSSSFAATNDKIYNATASLTATDPTGVEGKGYTVNVLSGTTTIGSINYTVGYSVQRKYVGGSWTTNAFYSGIGSSAILGLVKLYGSFGSNADGSVNQNAISQEFARLVNNYDTLSGTNSYTVASPSIPFVPTAQGIMRRVKAVSTSTGLCTLNYSGFGAQTWYKNITTQAGAGDIVAGQHYIVVYDTTLGGWLTIAGGVSGGGGGSTDLGIANRTSTSLDVTSSTGNDATVPEATSSLAGLLNATDKTKLDSIDPNVIKTPVKYAESFTKGQACYVSGGSGTNVLISKADNTSEATSSKTLGLVETTGATNTLSNVITDGILAGLDTSTATIGDPVWLGTAGNLIYGLANKPVAPAHLVYIGVVTRVSATVGEIFVKIQNGFELGEIHNILLASLVNNQTLVYEASTQLWKNKTVADALGYTPENVANKTTTIIGNESSTTLYASIKGFVDYLVGLTWFTDTRLGTLIAGLTAKTTPVDADLILVSDSADSNKAKDVTFLSLWNYIKAKADLIYVSLAGFTLTGTGGAGFIGYPPQSSDPSNPSTGFRLFASSSGLVTFLRSTGASLSFVLPSTRRTATFPNKDINVAGVADIKIPYVFTPSNPVSPLANTTYFFNRTLTLQTTNGGVRSSFPFSYIIRAVTINLFSTTGNTNTNDSTLYFVNITTGVTTTLGTFKTNMASALTTQHLRSLNVTVNDDELWCMRWDTPSGTMISNGFLTISLFLEPVQ